MSIGAIASKMAGLGSALATIGIQLSDEALRALISISDDFADDLARAMASGGDDFVNFINQNADDIARAVGSGGDDAVNGLRALAGNPQMLRMISTLNTALDDVLLRFTQSGADDLGRFVSQNYDDIVRQYGDDVASAMREHAGTLQTRLTSATQVLDDAARQSAQIADEVQRALEGAARTGTPPTSWLDRMILNRMKIAYAGGAVITGTLLAEYTTGGAISTWAAHRSLDIAHGLQDIDPELARQFADAGVDGVLFAADVSDTARSAAINYIAEMLEQEGRTEEAVVVRMGGVIFNPVMYAELMVAEQGERPEAFIARLERADISREDLATYLNNHPSHREMIETRLSIDLTGSLPGLTPKQETPVVTDPAATTTQGPLTAEQQGLLGEFNRLASASADDRLGVAQSIVNNGSFEFGGQEVFGMNLNSVLFSVFTWAAQNLDWVPGLGEAMRNQAVAMVTTAGAAQFGDVPQFNQVFEQIRGTGADLVANAQNLITPTPGQ